MVKWRQLLAGALAAALLCVLALPAAAASFPDLEQHWAKSYMEDLVERGYLKGYSDGTMKPDSAITACEALVFLSRFFSPTSAEVGYICDDYAEQMEEYVPSTLDWAKEEVAVCLAAGVVTEKELDGLDLAKPIEKELLGVFLLRAMRVEPLADTTELTFADKDDITASYRGDVAKLVELGIILGDNNNKFTPHLSVTRAVASTMVSRALAYMEEEKIEPVIEDYDGLSRAEGILCGVTSKTVQLRGLDGMIRVYDLGSNASISVNDEAKALSTSYVGCHATLSAQNGEITTLAVTYDSDITWVQGPVTKIVATNTANTVTITNVDTDKSLSEKVTSDLTLTVDGEKATFVKLKKGQFATLRYEGDRLTSLAAISGDLTLEGTVESISYGSTIDLRVRDEGGTLYSFPLPAGDMPQIKRGELTITIDRLNVGDEVSILFDAGEVETITATGTQQSVTGTLAAMTTTAEGAYWSITSSDGEQLSYVLDAGAGIYQDGKAISLSDIGVGDTISCVIYDGVITEVQLESRASTSDKISARVLAVSTADRTITALYGDKLVYIDTASATILSASTGKTLRLTDVESNALITAYGSYTASTEFQAKSVIIES